MSGVADRLRERVTIERRDLSADGFGGTQVSWQEVATVFAEVAPILSNVRERSIADQVKAVAGYRVRIRLRAGLDASMRLRWNGRVLQLHALHAHGELLEMLAYEEQV